MPVVPGPPPVSSSSPAAFSVPRPEGLVLSPFRALRYAERVDLAAVTAPPYDVIDADGIAALEQASDVNVVHLILPRDELRAGDRYGRAAAALTRWREEGVLLADPMAALYVYEQASTTHVQRGLLGAVALTPPEDGFVLPHESTMSGPVEDRLALYEAVEADLEPVFLLYGGGGAASEVVRAADQLLPLVDTTLGDGLRHRLWAVTDPARLALVQEDLRSRVAVIADGHHRWATYLSRQQRTHASGKGDGPWDQGLVLLVDSTEFGPEVHPIHRVLPRQEAATLATQAAKVATVDDLDGHDLQSALVALATAGADGPAYLLVSGDGATLRLVCRPDPAELAKALPPERSPAWRALDVSVLHHVLVAAVWGLTDDEEHVRYAHDVDQAVQLAAETGGTAVLLNATAAAAVAQVAAHGERMPRKSTLFTPKPRSGLVLRAFQDA